MQVKSIKGDWSNHVISSPHIMSTASLSKAMYTNVFIIGVDSKGLD